MKVADPDQTTSRHRSILPFPAFLGVPASKIVLSIRSPQIRVPNLDKNPFPDSLVGQHKMQLRFRSKINDNAKFEQAFQREFEAKAAPRWFRVLSGLVLLVGLGAIGYALLPDAVRLIALFLSAGAFVWLWSIGYGYWYRYFHSRYLHDSEDADICVVEVSDGRFTTEVRGYRTSFLLSSLSMAYEREDFVYLYFGRLGAARLPFSAFESDAQRSAFVALVESEKKEPNSEGSAAPQRAAGARLNKPVSSED